MKGTMLKFFRQLADSIPVTIIKTSRCEVLVWLTSRQWALPVFVAWKPKNFRAQFLCFNLLIWR